MSTDAAARIREALVDENAHRRRRGAALVALWATLTVALSVVFGIRPELSPVDLLATLVAGTFLLFGTLAAFLPHLRFGVWTARGIAAVALLSPLLAAQTLGSADSALAAGAGCMGTIVGVGAVTLVAGRLVMGAYRRRFGGALLLQGVAAAMVGCIAVGLHCPLPEGLHLFTHVVGALLVAAVLRRLTLSA